jgi:hypothetical protein
MGELASGVISPVDRGTPTGVEVHTFASTPMVEGMPNAVGYTLRQVGDEHTEQSIQVGWALPVVLGKRGPLVFARLMFDLIAWQPRADGDRQLSALSPTFAVGIAPLALGVCLSGEATYELHTDQPDRVLVGAFIGLCGANRKR